MSRVSKAGRGIKKEWKNIRLKKGKPKTRRAAGQLVGFSRHEHCLSKTMSIGSVRGLSFPLQNLGLATIAGFLHTSYSQHHRVQSTRTPRMFEPTAHNNPRLFEPIVLVSGSIACFSSASVFNGLGLQNKIRDSPVHNAHAHSFWTSTHFGFILLLTCQHQQNIVPSAFTLGVITVPDPRLDEQNQYASKQSTSRESGMRAPPTSAERHGMCTTFVLTAPEKPYDTQDPSTEVTTHKT